MKRYLLAVAVAVATAVLAAPAAQADTPIPPDPSHSMSVTVTNGCAGAGMDTGVITVVVANPLPTSYTLQAILDSKALTKTSGVNGAFTTFTFRHVPYGEHAVAAWAEPWWLFGADSVMSDCTNYGPTPVAPHHPKPHVNPAPASVHFWHTVRRHDTLWHLAAKFLGCGHRWHSIARLNHLHGTGIRVGQRLEIR